MEKTNFESQIMDAIKQYGRPMPEADLLSGFDDPAQAKAVLSEVLSAQKLIKTKRGKLALPEQTGLVYGRIQGNVKGFGFFIPDNGTQDAYISPEALNGAMDGDKVWVRISDNPVRYGSVEGEVVLIAERANAKIVGTVKITESIEYATVIPDSTRLCGLIYVKPNDLMGAGHNDKVVVSITCYPDSCRPYSTGKVVEVLGHFGEKGVDILSVARRFGLVDKFRDEEIELARIRNRQPDEASMQGRLDLRDKIIFTIDGADAKDLDDAVSLERLNNGNMLLGVHIADVSHYVRQGDALDRCALERGTSVYLIDRVIPMLPPDLSNGACSLNPNEDKLTLSAFMEIDNNGAVVSHWIQKSVINSKYRLVYDDVTALLEGDETLRKKYAQIRPMLEDMHALMLKLNRLRMNRGAIDFELPEAKITLDENGFAINVELENRGIANRIIEEFMLLANETVAAHMRDALMPMVYRVHEQPDMEKLGALNEFLASFGYEIRDIEHVTPKRIAELLETVKGRDGESAINQIVLRALKKARYSTQDLGHFGLASECYCHFTSPIRRYPDLIVHRLVKATLDPVFKNMSKLAAGLDSIADSASLSERIAMEAERCVDDMKKCEYMQRHLGEEFEGIISGVSQTGFFVTLPNTVEGMVRLAALEGDYFVLDEKNYRVVGKHTGREFRLGQPVGVKVLGVDMEAFKVEFGLSNNAEPAHASPRGGAVKRRRNARSEPEHDSSKRRRRKKLVKH